MSSCILTRPVSGGGGSTIPGMSLTLINGQPKLTIEDTTRANKILTVAEIPVAWNDNRVGSNQWISIGNAVDAASAYVAPFDGTVVSVSGQCENVRNNDKNIHLYINAVDQGSIGSLTGSGLDTFINTTLNVDFTQGDEIRLRAVDGNAGNIQDTVVKLILKWRG